MALEQKLSVRMSQKLIMTQSLQQAIKLLQMSRLELADEIQLELVENPVLEEAQASAERAEEQPEQPRDDPFPEIDYESYFQDVDGGYVPRAPVDRSEDLPSFENVLTRPQNLADHLT